MPNDIIYSSLLLVNEKNAIDSSQNELIIYLYNTKSFKILYDKIPITFIVI